jgi:outer membrane protein assembly factor BamB
VSAYALLTGRPLWLHADTLRFDSVIAGDGPRAVPTIDGGRVFTMGSTGLLNALDFETGGRLWAHDVVKENDSFVPDFGKVSAPLVVGDLVIVSAGGGGRSLVAYKKDTGERAWAAGDDRSGYGSPALVRLLGRPQVLVFNAGSVAAHDPESGKLLWEHPWPKAQPNVAQPLKVSDDRVLFSAGYGVGSKLFQIAQGTDGAYQTRLLWETPRLKSKFVNMVHVDGFVYGLDDGILACLDPATGERKWKAGRYGHGQMILIERTLLVQTEEGELVLVDPGPEGLKEVARFQALDGKTWNPPALAAPYLLVRNDKEAACYELPLEK